MKRFISLIVVTLILLSSVTVFAEGNKESLISTGLNILETIKGEINDLIKAVLEKFKDIKSTDWYVSTVAKLVELGGIDGYSDGTFKPNKEMTRGEFIKVLLATIGYDEEPSKSGHWVTNYFNKAVELGIITDVRVKGAGALADRQARELGIVADMDKKELDKPIKRHEASRMIYMAMDLRGEEMVDNWHDYISQIKDLYDIPVETERFGITDDMGTVYHITRDRHKILQVYAKGIVSGYPDGTFKPNKSLTRAEGSALVMRLIDNTQRIIPSKPILEEDWIEPEFELFYTTDYKDEYDYFEINVVNRKEYENKGQYQNYKFTTILQSPKRIQNVLQYGLIDKEWFEFDIMKFYKDENIGKAGSGFYHNNMIYKFGDIRRFKDINTKKPLVIKEGEEIKYKIIVSNGKKEKEYYINAEFRDKEFRH